MFCWNVVGSVSNRSNKSLFFSLAKNPQNYNSRFFQKDENKEQAAIMSQIKAINWTQNCPTLFGFIETVSLRSKNGQFSASFSLFFVFSKQLTVNDQYNFLPMTGFEPGPLELEATALPTEPQPLPETVSWLSNLLVHEGDRHSTVDPSELTSLQTHVRIPSTTSTLFRLMKLKFTLHLWLDCKQSENKQKEAHYFSLAWSSRVEWFKGLGRYMPICTFNSKLGHFTR